MDAKKIGISSPITGPAPTTPVHGRMFPYLLILSGKNFTEDILVAIAKPCFSRVIPDGTSTTLRMSRQVLPRLQNALKHMGESILCGSGLPAILRRRHGARRVILAYHNVVSDDAPPFGDQSLHLPLSSFVEQIDQLGTTHELVPLHDLAASTSHNRPLAAVTFDDAYRGAVRLALPELVQRAAPATIFVAPAFVGGRSFWWDDLAETGGLSNELRDTALGAMKGQDVLIRHRWNTNEVTTRPQDWTVADQNELLQASSLPGITLGSHSWSHPDLSQLIAEDLERELRDSLVWLRSRFDNVIPWLSCPYGRCSRDVVRVARRIGYEGALLISGGPFDDSPGSPFVLPRVNVPAGVSVKGLDLRTAGVIR